MLAAPLFSPLLHAQSYAPGVSVGQSVTFGQISVSWRSSGTPPSFLQQLNQTASITNLVTAVNTLTNNVTATQTYNYKNGTMHSETLYGNVQSGQGNLSIWILAGGLSAGDPLTKSSNSFLGPITETVSRVYAGSVRPVNLLVVNNTFGYGSFYLNFAWDQSTGFLLEVTEDVSSSYPVQNYTIHAKVTATNVWGASSAQNFTFDATPQSSLPVHRGQSARFNLNLTSVNGFQAAVVLSPALLNSSLTNPPTLSLGQSSVSIPYAGSVVDRLTLSTTASTPLGLYLFRVTGSGGGLSHDVELAVYVVPPDFQIFATPSNLTIMGGSSKTSTITVEALGAFSGTVGLASSSDSPLVQTSMDHASVVLSSTATIVNSTLTVSVSSFALPGVHSASVTASSGSLQHTTTLTVNVSGQDFQISILPSTLSMTPGASATATVQLTSVGGFSGTVVLSASVYTGVAVAFSPQSVAVSSTSQSILGISVAPNTIGGDYFITVTGSSGVLSHSTELSVTVTAAGFSFSVSSYILTIPRGTNTTSTISLSSLNGFQGTVALAASVLGPQLGYSLSPTSVTLASLQTATSTLTVSVPATAQYSWSSIQLFAVSGNLSSQIYITVNIPASSGPPPPPTPDFGIYTSPTFLNAVRGGTVTSTVILSSSNGFSGQVSLSAQVQGGPSGTCPGVNCPTASIGQMMLFLSAGGNNSTGLSIAVPITAPGGFYIIVVTGTNGTLVHYTDAFLTVTVPDFSVSYNTLNLDFPDGGYSATPAVVLSSTQGFTGGITLTRTVQGPAGVCPGPNCPMAVLASTSLILKPGGLNGTGITITTTASTPSGNYLIVVNATSGSVFHTATLYLTVGFRDFTIFGAPSTMILAPGGSGKLSVSLSSLNGFGGIVTLSTVYTSGLMVSPSVQNISLASGAWASTTLTISVPSSLTAGTYSAELRAVNGMLTHYVFFDVVVPVPDFGMSISPSTLTVLTGGQGGFTITLVSLDGLQATVSLNVLNVTGTGCPGPSCPTASLTRSTVPLAAGGWGYSNVTVSAPSTALPGYYAVHLVVSDGSVSRFVALTVDVVSHTSTVVSCGSPVLAGLATSCTVTVTNTSANTAAPSGIVAMMTNSTGTFSGPCFLSSVTVTSSACSVNYVPTVARGHRITANYLGDSTHGASSGFSDVTATIRSSSITVSCSTPVLVGQASSCQAMVMDTSGAGAIAPSGSVSFTESGAAGSFSSSPCALVRNGSSTNSSYCIASFTVSASGSASIGASYSGDGAHTSSSTTSPAVVTVNKRTSSISVSCTSPVVLNQGSLCTATVSDSSTAGVAITPSGTVTFSSSGPGSLSASSCILTGGSCSVSFTGTGLGSTTVNVSYGGDSAHTGSASTPASIVISLRVTTTSLSCVSPVGVGQPSTCTATVVDVSPGTVSTPTGSVGFTSTGSGSLGASSCVLAAGSCTVKFTGSAAGTAAVIGAYGADASHSGSISGAAGIAVNSPDFSLTVAPSSLAITQGSSGSTTISFTPQYGFTGNVALSASSVNGITVTFTPGSINSTQSSTVRFVVAGGVATGSYPINVTGTSGSLTHQKSLLITVTSPPAQTTQPILGLPTAEFYGLVGGIVAAVAAGLGIRMALKKRRNRSGSSVQVPPSSSTG